MAKKPKNDHAQPSHGRAPLIDQMAAEVAHMCGEDWNGIFEASREFWRKHVRVSLAALAKGAEMLPNEEARVSIPRIVEYITKGA